MAISNYSYEIKDGKIIITDMCQLLGGMSVTNNIENIIKDIEEINNIDAKSYICHYYDSEGELTGWDTLSEEFYPIKP